MTREPLTYSLAEAAQRVGGVTERWLATGLRAGELPGHKIGRQWRMSEADIQHIIDKSRVVPRPTPVIEAAVAQRPPRVHGTKSRTDGQEQYSLFD